MAQRKIAFLGVGNIASAMIAGLVESGYPASQIIGCNPSDTKRDALHKKYGTISSDDNLASARLADVIVLSVKPMKIAEVCGELRRHVDLSNKLILSVASGITVSRITELLGPNLHIVRVMPNTPSLIGEGMCGLYAAPEVSQEERQYTAQLMSALGKICWVDRESGINDIIAVAGSAPAYFFLFMESMQQEAERMGFSQEDASLLVQQTAIGAAAMVAANPQLDIGTLREQVTSKGGTTAAALQVMRDEHLPEAVVNGMRAAVARAQEMEKLF
ncbi:MAG: pyrroline-5-carboxylate reductase [Enterobacteriaceae bacterium]